jgi:hypothetical protein
MRLTDPFPVGNVAFRMKLYSLSKVMLKALVNANIRPRHSSGGLSPASHRGGPGSNPGLVMWDFVVDKSGAGPGFLQELPFPLPIYIPSGSP